MAQPNRREKKGLVIFLLVIALAWIGVELFSYFQKNESQSEITPVEAIETVHQQTEKVTEKERKEKPKSTKEPKQKKNKSKNTTLKPQPKPTSPLERPVERKTNQ